ncbi:hypothetical protein [Enterovibrio calviensis]|uniref:hypothetical protein n=1 Tax=Enterovibrio calviensis TaxID=91359 RepID=UPI003735769F
MKARDLKTIYDLIVTEYKMVHLGEGRFLHTFKPKTTNTIYQFEANGTPEMEENARYNIGYRDGKDGQRIIDLSCISKSDSVNPMLSYLYSQEFSKERHNVNKAKNDDRVTHGAKDGYYWGKKYAWREFGLVISKDAFYAYLEQIGHPKVPCTTANPAMAFSNDPSTAYKEEGLAEAMELLITTAEKKTKALYSSPHYNKRFNIRGVDAITDKK